MKRNRKAINKNLVPRNKNVEWAKFMLDIRQM